MDFQVVILAGCEYANLSPLTPVIPKMLLPIGNKPMIACVLDAIESLCERFHPPILIASPHDPQHHLASYLETYIPAQGLNQYQIIDLPAGCVNTVEILTYLVKQHLQCNLVLISGDTLLDSDVLRKQLEHFRRSSPHISVLLTQRQSEEKAVYGLWENRLVAIGSEENGVTLKRSLLRRCPDLTLRSSLSDCYCYLFDQAVLSNLVNTQRVTACKGIKQDLIPLLVRHQMDKNFLSTISESLSELVIAYFQVPDGFFAMRSNNLRSYIDLNLKCCYPFGGKDKKGKAVPPQPVVLRKTKNNPENILDTFLRPQAQPPAFIKMISNDCIIGVNFSAGVGSSVSTSVVGRDVHLGGKAKVSQSILMDNVTIEDDVTISASVVGKNAVIRARCKILNSQIAAGAVIEPNTTVKDSSR